MPRFIQVGCREEDAIDSTQAEAVLKHRPDIILFEYPQEKRTPDTVFNKYPPNKKPKRKLAKLLQKLKANSKNQPWVASDIQVFKSISKLWSGEKQVYVYFIDAPSKVTSLRLDENEPARMPFPKTKKYLWWWKKMYQRESYMTKHIRWIFKKHKKNLDNLTILVFLEKFHWQHVQFRLRNPSKSSLQKYYFGAFK